MKNYVFKTLSITLIISFILYGGLFCLHIHAENLNHQKTSNNHTYGPQQTLEYDSEYYAIIIGIEKEINNTNNERSDLSAISFYQALLNGVNWNENNVRMLINEQATKETIQSTIKDWLDPLESEKDIILFYYNGNIRKTSFQPQLNINKSIDLINPNSTADTVTDIEIDNWFDELESQQIFMIIDTDYASYLSALKQRGRDILASTGLFFPKKDNEMHRNQISIVSHFLQKGFLGYADLDGNDIIDSSELYIYTITSTSQYSIDHMKISLKRPWIHFQTPMIFKKIWKNQPLFTLSFGWKQLSNDGFGKNSNYATRGMGIFKNELYIGTQNNFIPNGMYLEKTQIGIMTSSLVPDFYSYFGELSRLPVRLFLHLMTVCSQGCEIWKYNYSSDQLIKVIGSNSISGINEGFGSHYNAAASVMKEYNGYLYVGTWNTPLGSIRQPIRKGCEIWRTPDGHNWEQVVGHQAPFVKGGFGNPDNTGAWSIQEFNNYLYVGTMNWDFSETGGCEVWRTQDGVHWEQVVDHGFRPFMSESDRDIEAINTYAWIMQEYQGELYMGTFNARLWLRNQQGTGCQLWKTSDGEKWEKVSLPIGNVNHTKDGFGEAENYGIRQMVIYNDELYVGVASSFFHDHGCEIWKFNGTRWSPVISDEVSGVTPEDFCYDGFGNTMNKYIWTMTVTKDNKLWVGTANGQVYLPIIYKGERENRGIRTETDGCEIWCFDGEYWEPVIKNDIGLKPNGLGDSSNLGARSMIEYPKNSGNLIIGTFKLFNTRPDEPLEGCELWIRYNHSD